MPLEASASRALPFQHEVGLGARKVCAEGFVSIGLADAQACTAQVAKPRSGGSGQAHLRVAGAASRMSVDDLLLAESGDLWSNLLGGVAIGPSAAVLDRAGFA